MSLTIFGVAVIAIGMLLFWQGTVTTLLAFTMLCSLMGGSAAIALPALGNSTVPPANLALVFLVFRCLMPGRGQMARLRGGVAANLPLALFVLYGAAGAVLLPWIFAGSIDVTPLRPTPGKYLFAAEPLRFTNQNVTVAVYLVSTLLASICGYAAAQTGNASRIVARLASVIAIVHASLGIASVALAGTPFAAFFAFFRNGFYAQLNQSFSGVVRMNGIWAEPAVFAAYGVIWLVFTAELWLRNIDRRWSGPAFALMLGALVLSTSSTAYLGILGYGVVLLLRQILVPTTIPADKFLVIAITVLTVAAGLLAFSVIYPDVGRLAFDLLERTTVGKLETESGTQRRFWAMQGYHAFVASAGLGIGPGSFRSSSLITAILGSVGIVGSLAFLVHLARVFRPFRRSTYVLVGDVRQRTGAAASWSALMMLFPVSFSAASPDPGLLWGMIGGFALAFRENRKAGVTNFANPDFGHRGVTTIRKEAAQPVNIAG